MASHMANAGQVGGAQALARARALERGNDFARAIDAYLGLSPADVEGDLDALQQCWEQVKSAGC